VTTWADLHADELTVRLPQLGFTETDGAATLAAAAAVLADPESRDRLGTVVDWHSSAIGRFLARESTVATGGPRHYDQPPVLVDSPSGVGVLALLAMVATAPAVQQFHRSRRVPEYVSTSTLADLGRHVAIHRATNGNFGLETHQWLMLHWSGALYQLGRLQYRFTRLLADEVPDNAPDGVTAGSWIAELHIPQQGPLTAERVRESLDSVRPFVRDRFPEIDLTIGCCSSWLLDPHLQRVLPAESNIVRFQRLFTPYGPTAHADEDVVYYTFRHRALDSLRWLPRDTTLRRAVLDRIEAGDHWNQVAGWLPL
jgi:hypothetical protein